MGNSEKETSMIKDLVNQIRVEGVIPAEWEISTVETGIREKMLKKETITD